MTGLLRHVRRPGQMIRGGYWHIRCDCGWSGKISPATGERVLRGDEVEAALERQFVAHLPEPERQTYLLVDQRPVATMVANEQGEWEERMVARGTFIMPLGKPCMLTSWTDEGGVFFGNYLVPEDGEHGHLPIGEIRTGDARVFKCRDTA